MEEIKVFCPTEIPDDLLYTIGPHLEKEDTWVLYRGDMRMIDGTLEDMQRKLDSRNREAVADLMSFQMETHSETVIKDRYGRQVAVYVETSRTSDRRIGDLWGCWTGRRQLLAHNTTIEAALEFIRGYLAAMASEDT